MPAVTTAELVAAAAHDGGAVAAFNVITLEHAEAIVDGAEQAGVPVILQVSENAVRFHHGRLGPLAGALRALLDGCPARASLHLDHIESRRLLDEAPDQGFSSVMFDASALPYEQNVAASAAAADFAHRHGLWVEAELGTVGGKDGQILSPHAPGARTDPVQAAAFVGATGVDALAVAVGSSHARTSRDAVLDHGLIERLRRAVPVPLVLHGSSGVPDDELLRAVAGGIAKVNIGTALNVAFTAAVRDQLDRDSSIVDPRRYVGPAREEMARAVARFLTLLRPTPLRGARR